MPQENQAEIEYLENIVEEKMLAKEKFGSTRWVVREDVYTSLGKKHLIGLGKKFSDDLGRKEYYGHDNDYS